MIQDQKQFEIIAYTVMALGYLYMFVAYSYSGWIFGNIIANVIIDKREKNSNV